MSADVLWVRPKKPPIAFFLQINVFSAITVYGDQFQMLKATFNWPYIYKNIILLKIFYWLSFFLIRDWFRKITLKVCSLYIYQELLMRVGFSKNHIINIYIDGHAKEKEKCSFIYLSKSIRKWIVAKVFFLSCVSRLTFLGLDKYKASVMWCGLIYPINNNFLCNKTQ